MKKKKLLSNTRLMFVSPWIVAGAIGLLTLIIVIFAANNIQREKGMMTENMFRKGQSLIRFVEAGMRASMMTGMGNRHRLDGWSSHSQHLVEQAAADPDILYIAVIDETGRVITHSDPEKVGQVIVRATEVMPGKGVEASSHIISLADEGRKAFEVVSVFEPLRHQRGRFRNLWQQFLAQAGPDTQIPQTVIDMMRSVTSDHYILVGLDMTNLEKTQRQYQLQIIFLSLALLFVGLGGWISLMAAQAYRISQESLHRIQAFTGQLITRLPVGIIATDSQGRIKTVNEAAVGMIGRDMSSGLNRLPREVLPQEVVAFFEVKNPASTVHEKEISLDNGDGNHRPLHLSSVPVASQEGDFMGRVLLMYDLSEIKQLERQVQRHERLVALGKMAAGVAHEVRNPLSSIKGFATLLGAKFSRESKEYEAAELMVHEVERLNRSITELLDYARPTPLKLEPVNLADILNSSLRLIAADAETLGITVDIDIRPDTPDVKADPDRLNQVLLNLYLNGLQAMENGGSLLVSARKGDGAMVDIRVADSGCGISEEMQERVMDPYFTTKPQGTGLGLAMAYKIIEEHGGTIRFVSKKGEGTTFILSLPQA